MEKSVNSITHDRTLFGILAIAISSISLSYVLKQIFILPATPLDTAKIEALFARPVSEFVSDSHEFTGLVFYVISVCVIAVALTFLYNKYKDYIGISIIRIANPILLGLTVCVTVIVSLRLVNVSEKFYLEPFSLQTAPLESVIALVAIAGLIFFFYRDKRSVKTDSKLEIGLTRNIPQIFDFCVIIIIICTAAFYIADVDLNIFTVHHLTPVFNPIYEIENGHTLGVDFDALYGFYAYLFWAVQKILFGHITTSGTVLVMAALTVIANILLYVAVFRISKKRILSFLTLCSVILFSQLFPLIMNGGPFFQYSPLRVITPTLMLFFVAMYHTELNKGKRKAYFIAAVLLCGAGICWNMETGAVSTITFLGYCVYDRALKYRITDKAFWMYIIKCVGAVLFSIIISLLSLGVITQIISGKFLDVPRMIWAITVFAKEGFYMLPLPEDHPYLLVLFLYSLAIIIPITKIKSLNKEDSATGNSDYSLMFAIAVLGFGSFIYFLGRSHLYTFLLCIWPAFVLLPCFLDKIIALHRREAVPLSELRQAKLHKKASAIITGALAAIVVGTLCFSGISLFTLGSVPRWEHYLTMREDTIFPENPAEINFLRPNLTEHTAVIHRHSCLYMSQLGAKNEYVGPAIIDYFYKQDFEDFLSFISDYNGRIIIESGFFQSDLVLSGGETMGYILTRIADEKYVIVVSGEGMTVMDRK